MQTVNAMEFSEPIYIRSEFGPISFGLILASSIVPWSGHGAKDLLVSRCWEGVYLYPSTNLQPDQLLKEPLKVLGSPVSPTMGHPVDWNKDGQDDLLVADRNGFLHLFLRKGEYPSISFDYAETITDPNSGLVINLPYDNPNHVTDSLDGYIDPNFFNYSFPVVYPNKISPHAADLIVGDWSGNLWWLPDASNGVGKPYYEGIPYTKKPGGKQAEYGRAFMEKYGDQYARPMEKICDEQGNPFLLGDGVDGGDYYQGCNARPVGYRNPITGSDDLLVLSGSVNNIVFYLERMNHGEERKPVFRNLGEVRIEGLAITDFQLLHSKLIVDQSGQWNELMISLRNHIAILRNKRLGTVLPEFELAGFISDRDTITCGDNVTEILVDPESGRRYLLDNGYYHWELREIMETENGIRLSSRKIPLEDQDGIFKVGGETDPQLSPKWGINHAAKWDFDNSGRQHLIVGTDRGMLFLLIDEGEVGAGDRFKYKSVGPLRDSSGQTIRIHSRSCPGAIDLDGDGREDLIVGGATYQMGFRTDPNPGADVYYLKHKGLDHSGLPVLDTPVKLPVEGYPFQGAANRMIELQVIDLDRDGRKEVVLSSGIDRHIARVYRPADQRIGLVFTGSVIPGMSYGRHLMDLDGDDELELVYAGNESGVASYCKLKKS